MMRSLLNFFSYLKRHFASGVSPQRDFRKWQSGRRRIFGSSQRHMKGLFFARVSAQFSGKYKMTTRRWRRKGGKGCQEKIKRKMVGFRIGQAKSQLEEREGKSEKGQEGG